MGKDGLKNFPLNRYVVDRDGNGNVIEIVTKELISRKVLGDKLPKPKKPNVVRAEVGSTVQLGTRRGRREVYTHVRLDKKNGRWIWHQEWEDRVLPDSRGSAPKNTSPWLVLWMNL